MKNRIRIKGGIETGVIAEGALVAQFARLHVSFQNEINICRDLQIYRFTAKELYRSFANKTRKQHFIQSVWQRRCGGERVSRIAPETYRNGHAFIPLVVASAVASTDFMDLPMHAGCLSIKYLHPIHANIALTGVGILRVDHRQRYESSAIFRPANQDR